jgi:hypothetical protein
MHEPTFLFPYADLMLSLSLFVPGLIPDGSRPDVRRRQTLRISLGPLPLGLAESLYWSSVHEHLAWKRRPGAESVPVGSPVGSAR